MKRADAALRKIRRVVQSFDNQEDFHFTGYATRQEIKARITEGGKRSWMQDHRLLLIIEVYGTSFKGCERNSK